MPEQEIIEDLEILTAKIMKNEGVVEYDLHIEGQTEKGTNYGSEIVFFSVTPKMVSKKYNFVMKTTKRSKKLREEVFKNGALDIREVHVYSKVVPALRQMLAESKSEFHLENMVKIYLVHQEFGHETMIMENLRSQGYRLWNKRKPMNLEHIKTVLSNYGKYHASSMALRTKKPEVFDELTKEMDSVLKCFVNDENVKNLFRDYMNDALEVLKKSGLKDIAEKLKEVPENSLNILAEGAAEEDKVVITHGDCWINNMMFKYECTNLQPLGVCFLDFQISSFGSPATDLSYYLYTSCDEETITNQFDSLLQFYYDAFSSTLKQLDLDPEKVFSIQKLKDHWRKYALFGLIMAAQVIKIQLTNKDEAPPDLSVSEDFASFRIGEIEDNDIFESRIVAVFTHYAKMCLS